MSQIKRKRISLENLSENMILSDDVVDYNGSILIPKDTIITQKHIFRLKLYQILSVVIKDIPNSNIPISVEPELKSAESSHSFLSFKNQYLEKEEITKSQLLNISDGNAIDLDDLLSTSTNLLSTLRTRGDLFNFLYHLRNSDDFTYSHCLNVSLLCNVFGYWLKLPQEQIELLTISGLLHDIGKLQIDIQILNKPGKLTENEFNIVKKHTFIGYELVKNLNIPEEVKYGILMHHEKTDGSGYPLGLKDARIHDFGKIIAIADIFDAMTSYRSYHAKFSPFKVIQVFEQESYGLLDVNFLFIFLENIAHNYLGKMVRLSNGDEAKVIFIHNQSPSRPIVQVADTMIDLLTMPSLSIEEIL